MGLRRIREWRGARFRALFLDTDFGFLGLVGRAEDGWAGGFLWTCWDGGQAAE